MKALVLFALLTSLWGCIASGSFRYPLEDDPLQVQWERFRAMEQGDLGALEPLLSDDLSYTHTGGRTESKTEFLQILRSGSLRYLSIQPDSVVLRSYGKTAVVNGRSRMRVRNSAGEQAFSIRFLEVYVREAGRWQLAAWQATRLPQ